jgi:hypothetical protein
VCREAGTNVTDGQHEAQQEGEIMGTTVNRGAWRSVVALCGLAMAVGCASTEMTNTWFDPAAMGQPLHKVAVIALTKDPGMRRMAETEASKQVKGTQVIPSYLVLSDEDLRSRDVVKAKLQDQGFDGALVMRLAAVTEQVTNTGYYGTFDSYYDWASNTVYAPGYLSTDVVVDVVSSLYSLPQDKLIWSGTSRTFDPASAKEVVGDVSKQVAKEIKKDRLVL